MPIGEVFGSFYGWQRVSITGLTKTSPAYSTKLTQQFVTLRDNVNTTKKLLKEILTDDFVMIENETDWEVVLEIYFKSPQDAVMFKLRNNL